MIPKSDIALVHFDTAYILDSNLRIEKPRTIIYRLLKNKNLDIVVRILFLCGWVTEKNGNMARILLNKKRRQHTILFSLLKQHTILFSFLYFLFSLFYLQPNIPYKGRCLRLFTHSQIPNKNQKVPIQSFHKWKGGWEDNNQHDLYSDSQTRILLFLKCNLIAPAIRYEAIKFSKYFTKELCLINGMYFSGTPIICIFWRRIKIIL